MTLTQTIRAHLEALDAEQCPDAVDHVCATNIRLSKSTAVLAFYFNGADFARHLLAENSRILKEFRKFRTEQINQAITSEEVGETV